MATKKSVQTSEEEFIASVKESLDDAEKLLREAADATGDKAAELRESAMISLRRTREALYNARARTQGRTRHRRLCPRQSLAGHRHGRPGRCADRCADRSSLISGGHHSTIVKGKSWH